MPTNYKYIKKSWEDETNLSKEIQKKVFSKHFDGPIFFGFANKFLTMTQSLPEVDVVIMRMKRVPYIDQSGIYAIEDAVMALQEKNVLILLTGLQDQPRDMLLKVSLIPNLIPEDNLYNDFHSAIKALRTGNISFL